MSITFLTSGWSSVFGPIDVDLVSSEFLMPKGFSLTDFKFPNVNTTFTKGSKNITLIHSKSNEIYSAILEFYVSRMGYLMVNLSFPIHLELYSTIRSELFTSEDQYFNYSNISIQQMVWQLSTALFDVSLIEFQLAAELNLPTFQSFCKKYGVDPISRSIYLSISHYTITDTEDEWQSIIFSEKRTFESNSGSMLGDTIVIPNFENTKILFPTDCQILFSLMTIVYSPTQLILHSILHNILGLNFKQIGVQHLNQVLSDVLTNIKQLNSYIHDNNETKSRISWIYVEERLQNIELEYRMNIDHHERILVHKVETQVYNFEKIDTMDVLEEYHGTSQTNSIYYEKKNLIEQQLTGIRHLVTNKGEKEEQQATERIVTVVGFLALFEVISQILPIFPDKTALTIRLAFLITIIPLLILLWIVTQTSALRKKAKAENLHAVVRLQQQKVTLNAMISQLEQTKSQEMIELSTDYLDHEITKLQEMLDPINKEIQSRERNL